MAAPKTIDTASSCASAAGPDAAARAAEQALRALDEPALILAFPSGVDPSRAASEIARIAPRTPLAGMTGNGSIGSGGPIAVGCSVLALGAGAEVGVGVATGAGRALRRAAHRATGEALAGLGEPAGTVLLFLDTRSGDQAEAVGGAYAAAGHDVPLVGGAAGGAEPAQLCGARALRDAVVAVAIGRRHTAGIGIAHGCRTMGVPAIATRSSGRRLLELDGRPAATVYLERLGHAGAEIADQEFERLAVTHPLAQPELNGSRRLRHVLARGPEGSLELATHIPANAAVEFTHQPEDEIIAASGRAVESSLAELGDRPPRAALIIDCAGRKRAVGSGLDREVRTLIDAFGRRLPPVAGLFSHGEVCRTRGAKGDRNHAVVVASFA